MLEENKTLLTLNIESNLLTGTVVADICRATLKNQTLMDLRLSNQVKPSSHIFNSIALFFNHRFVLASSNFGNPSRDGHCK
jgi:hypothetical protein